jgi:hypothetical protein
MGIERHQVQRNTKSPDNTPTRIKIERKQNPIAEGFSGQDPTGILVSFDIRVLLFFLIFLLRYGGELQRSLAQTDDST